jgi:hypothetical protein
MGQGGIVVGGRIPGGWGGLRATLYSSFFLNSSGCFASKSENREAQTQRRRV